MISILIVNWNTRDFLQACLRSIETHCAGYNHEVIVVENASHDGSAAMVKREFPRVTLLESSENLGFAAGNNLAFEKSCGQWIWLLNPDTELFPNAGEALVKLLESQPQAGAVASALVDARTRRVQRSCRTFPYPRALWVQACGLARAFPRSRRFGFYKMGWWNYRDARCIEQPMASSLMLPRHIIEAIGGLFDTRFPIFFNDVELCWRIQQQGYEVWFEPQSRVVHWGGASTSLLKPEMIVESHRSLRLFYHLALRGKISPWIYGATIVLIALSARARRDFARLWKNKTHQNS